MNNTQHERETLLKEISDLKEKLLWYKRTYEERSLLGIIYQRLFKRDYNLNFNNIARLRFPFIKRVRISKSKMGSLLPKRILSTIVNHNHSENAKKLFSTLNQYFDLVILDSGSIAPPPGSIKYGNIYYSGLLNEAYKIARDNKYDYIFFICSDVLIQPQEALKIYERLMNFNFQNLGLYSPASKGGGHSFCKRRSLNGLRTVPFVEGFLFLCDLDILQNICPIDTRKNQYGWGLDIVAGYFAKKDNKLCFIDDDIEVEHLVGTGYSRDTAELEMLSWIKNFNDKEVVSFFEDQVDSIKEESGF